MREVCAEEAVSDLAVLRAQMHDKNEEVGKDYLLAVMLECTLLEVLFLYNLCFMSSGSMSTPTCQ